MYIKTKCDDVEIEFGDFESPSDIVSAMNMTLSAVELWLESGRVKKIKKIIENLDNDENEDDKCVPHTNRSSGRYPYEKKKEVAYAGN